jgi:GNAT superfamily N-acetyltransferase
MPEIQVRPAIQEDIITLSHMDHSYTSGYVWQMDYQPAKVDNSEKNNQVTFRQVRYPRAVRVEYPRHYMELSQNWNERSGLLVAQLEENPIGYISLELKQVPSATWVTDLVVHRRLRQQGIGSALLLAALDWAQTWGAEQANHMVVMEMQPKNHPAIQLAQKIGFDFSGYMDRYFPNGDIGLFFTKQLW